LIIGYVLKVSHYRRYGMAVSGSPRRKWFFFGSTPKSANDTGGAMPLIKHLRSSGKARYELGIFHACTLSVRFNRAESHS